MLHLLLQLLLIAELETVSTPVTQKRFSTEIRSTFESGRKAQQHLSKTTRIKTHLTLLHRLPYEFFQDEVYLIVQVVSHLYDQRF